MEKNRTDKTIVMPTNLPIVELPTNTWNVFYQLTSNAIDFNDQNEIEELQQAEKGRCNLQMFQGLTNGKDDKILRDASNNGNNNEILCDAFGDSIQIRSRMYIRKFLLEKIKSNHKTVEVRIASSGYKSIKTGNLIDFISGTETITRVVTYISKFSTFKEALQYEGLQNCLPGVDDLQQAIEFFYGLPGYENLEKCFGVLSFRLQQPPKVVLSPPKPDKKMINKSVENKDKFDGCHGVVRKIRKESAPVNTSPSGVKFQVEHLVGDAKIDLSNIVSIRKFEAKDDLWDDYDYSKVPNTQELIKTTANKNDPQCKSPKLEPKVALKLPQPKVEQNQLKTVPSKKSNATNQPMIQPSRNIKWLDAGKTYCMSKELLQDVYDSTRSTTRDERFFYRKDSIGIEIDRIFPGCVIYIDKRNNARKYWKLRAYCAHNGCRRYCLTASHSNPGRFTIEYDKKETCHPFPLARQVRKYERDVAVEESKTKFASDLRADRVNSASKDVIEAGSYQNNASSAVFEKIRSIATGQQDNAVDDVSDVETMYNNDPENDIVSNILSRKKFGVYVHGKKQHELLNRLHKIRELYGIQVVGRVDASGGIARDIDEFMMLYYALVVHIFIHNDDESTPVALSEQFNTHHTSKDIAAWMFDFVLSHNHFHNNPPVLFDWIISDFSYANFHGILRAFNSFTLKEYLNLAREWLQHKIQNGTFPQEFYKLVKIRMCYTHLMHTFAVMMKRHFGTIKNKQMPHSRILLEILAKMIICIDYEILLKLWKQLAILLKSEFINDDVENAIGEIDSVEPTVNLDDYDEEKLVQAVPDLDALKEYDCTLYKSNRFYLEFKTFADQIENYSYNNVKQEKNAYYNPQFLDKFLVRFVPLIPLWTSVLKFKLEPSVQTKPPLRVLDSDNNQPIESFFGYLKMKMDSNAVSIGKPPVKVGRAITFSQKIREPAIKAIELNIPKQRLNSQNPRKPYTKKKNAAVVNAKENQFNVSADVVAEENQCIVSDGAVVVAEEEQLIVSDGAVANAKENPINLEKDSSTFEQAKESYNKRRRHNQFSYFQSKGITKTVKKANDAAATKKKANTDTITTNANTNSKEKFRNGLWRNVQLYADVHFDFVVASKTGKLTTNKEFDQLNDSMRYKTVQQSNRMFDLCLICGSSDCDIPMVECTSCNRWMHCPCIKVTLKDVEADEHFKCPLCAHLKF